MSEPVDIKIAHINKNESINHALNKEEIYEIFERSTPEALAPFYKFQQTWVNKAYSTFKDFDTYLILMYLKQKIYVDYSDRFHYMSTDAFYSQDKIAIDKINLIQISKSLDIPKETVRRKVLELSKKDILKFDSSNGIKLSNGYKNIYSEFVSQTTNDLSSLINKWEKSGALKTLLELNK